MSIEEKDKIKEISSLLSEITNLEALSEPKRKLIGFLKELGGEEK